MFLQSCFIRKDTPEIRDELKKLGYHESIPGCTKFETNGLIASHNSEYGVYLGIHEDYLLPNVINCGENEDLFLALAALRDDSDDNQWFIATEDSYDYAANGECNVDFMEGEWSLYEEAPLIKDFPEYWRKATVEELIKHFSNEQRRTN